MKENAHMKSERHFIYFLLVAFATSSALAENKTNRLEAVKWKNWKVVFYDEERDWWTPPTKLGNSKAFDLITDPKEEYPQTGLRSSWIAGPAMKIAIEFEQSLKKYPPIAPGTADPYKPPKLPPPSKENPREQ